MDDRRGLLVIRAVISSDSGVYVCEARDSVSTVTEQTELRVGGRSHWGCHGGGGQLVVTGPEQSQHWRLARKAASWALLEATCCTDFVI